MSNKRDRELARARYERQAARRAQRNVRKHDFKQILIGLVAVAAIIGYAVTSGDSSDIASPSAKPSSSSTAGATDAPALADGCVPASQTRKDNITLGSAPTDAKAALFLDFATNCGVITVTLDPKAPKTGAIITSLVDMKYYDGIRCHRLTTDGIFVLQCGDPKGDGTGGPGFSFADENLPVADANGATVYKRGTVAMANAGANTNGSQFFLVYKDSPLPANYSVWGTITGGLDVIDSIAKAGVRGAGTDGAPAQDVVISLATATT
ncbi:unannotated protein [freshwater metagenome]|uniref:Unannotated protein n=1 Tax=freshwater metagenome TaxID=449393 RepID=A0A6J5ZHT2_9ZZZZ